MTGCGCGLVVAVLGVLLYVLLFGSSDPGEPVAQAVRLVAIGTALITALRALARGRARHAEAPLRPSAG